MQHAHLLAQDNSNITELHIAVRNNSVVISQQLLVPLPAFAEATDKSLLDSFY